jgi:nucleotide-binding universal stress UspA family protein
VQPVASLPPPGRVVVGIDGWWTGRVAVTEAAHAAVRRGTGLAIVTVEQPAGDGAAGLVPAAASVAAAEPDLTVTTHCLTGQPAAVLRTLSQDAALLVLGACGRGGQPVPAAGSVARRLLALAACPVLVASPRRICAGVDRTVLAVLGRGDDRAVVEVAGQEARQRGAELRLLSAGRPAERYSRDAALASGSLGRVLLDRAFGAELVVLDGRRGETEPCFVLDPVCRAVLASMPCSVLVLQPQQAQAREALPPEYRRVLERELHRHPDRPDGCLTPEELDDAWRVGLDCPSVGEDVALTWRACLGTRSPDLVPQL